MRFVKWLELQVLVWVEPKNGLFVAFGHIELQAIRLMSLWCSTVWSTTPDECNSVRSNMRFGRWRDVLATSQSVDDGLRNQVNRGAAIQKKSNRVSSNLEACVPAVASRCVQRQQLFVRFRLEV